MSDFIDRDEGLRLLEILQSGITADGKRPNMFPQKGEHPLYEFHTTKTGNHYTYPVMQAVFDLLGKNGYGRSYVGKEDQAFKNEVRGLFNSRASGWIGETDMARFDKVVYFFNFENNKGLNNIHYIPDRLCDGTIHAMLEHAMELGRFEKQGPQGQMAAACSAPQPQQH